MPRLNDMILLVNCLLIFVVMSDALRNGCICPGGNCNAGYDGNMSDCYCYCQETAHDLPHETQNRLVCTFIPKTRITRARCLLCGPMIKSHFIEELDQSLSVIPQIVNGKNIFPLRHCFCYNNNCHSFCGSRQSCVNWGRQLVDSFLDNSYSLVYVPKNHRSAGSCTMCGNVDPCSI
ncbi:hypothetical protein P9112_005565 [Eukaryota sp. TZLM1-RC]